MFAKVEVNGPRAHNVFRFVRAALPDILGSSIKWNWTKFLCDRDGRPVKRFAPPTSPLALLPTIEALLEAREPSGGMLPTPRAIVGASEAATSSMPLSTTAVEAPVEAPSPPPPPPPAEPI
jgi:hypothetical protein